MLPESAIAQTPLEPRDASRLLVMDNGELTHSHFSRLPDFLEPGDVLVLNNTRVSALRVIGEKATGGKVEALLLREVGHGEYEALVKPGRRLPQGTRVVFDGGVAATIKATLDDGGKLLQFEEERDLRERLAEIGKTPLPPYIRSEVPVPDRYQTVYCEHDGSSAAPAAGLHFTAALLESVRKARVNVAYITLDVGIDTFRPIKNNDLALHKMHGESYLIPPETARVIRNAKGRIIAVGTTSVRALESAAVGDRVVQAGSGCSSLFITPGYRFKVIDAMLTNFHLPKTTMMLMVSALSGRDNLVRAYEEALLVGYRFLSFGDSMLVIGENK